MGAFAGHPTSEWSPGSFLVDPFAGVESGIDGLLLSSLLFQARGLARLARRLDDSKWSAPPVSDLHATLVRPVGLRVSRGSRKPAAVIELITLFVRGGFVQFQDDSLG